MSSNIRIKKNCQLCNSEFIAKTTVTKYCSDNCAKIAYKARKRAEKINKARNPAPKTQSKKSDLSDIQQKDYLTVKEASLLLGCSSKSIYRMITNKTIQSVNLGQRMTRIKRTEIDTLFNQKA
ncbi:helix-turn-helix domain-containing protein [Salegentibacter chungangensis]|uniref:Helix-turn-helix domain-containing protein n=1 Tax=Salegentibacter chungangensis TaxID=1335724 RepID=A0ABW3NRC8_9FLAO